MEPRRALIISTALIFLTSAYLHFFLNKSEANVARQPLSAFPNVVDNWSGSDQSFPTRVLENLGVDEYLMRRFTDGKDSIWMYIGYYKNQREGAVPHSPRHCYPGSGFNPVRHDIVSIPLDLPGKREIRVNRYIFAKGLEREIVIYWYQSRGRVIADEYREKLYLIGDAIFRNRSDGALVRFSMGSTSETQNAATERLERFVALLYPHIPRVVPD